MRNTRWRSKIIPSPRQEKEYIKKSGNDERKNSKKIKIKRANQNEAKKFSIDQDILQILYSRGIDSEEKIKKFLNPNLKDIEDPLGLCDMEKAVIEIEKAILKQKNIWIYGDYDVDGITSTSVLYLALKELGAENVNYYIPIRDEGYGLNNEALKKIKDSGADLIITVDCGITAFSEVEFANSIDLPIIITDHHNLNGGRIPEALAVINPKRKENSFSFEFLAGVGTIFMVMISLFERAGKKEDTNKYLDLVAIGTVADIVPLTDENRIFTKFGLEQLFHTRHKGLKFLLYKLFFSNQQNTEKIEYTTYDVGFIIAPVFNAAGRLTDAKMVVKLLISDNDREIEVIVKELINRNFERKELQNKIVEKIENKIEKTDISNDFVIVDYSPEYHHGVIGIAASKIVDKYYKPVIIMEVKEDEGVAVGSCRSIANFNILEALQSMPELFLKFGGHSGAAGFTLPIKNIPLFQKKVNKFAKTKLTKNDFVKIIEIDKQIPIQKISYEFFQLTEKLKPFGFGNPTPTFRTNNVLFENIKFIGENRNHIMLDLKQKGFSNKNAVWFNSGEYFKDLNKNLIYDIVFKLKTEMYQNRFYTKVYIEDVKPSKMKDETLLYYHSLFNTSFPLKSIFYTNVDWEEDKKIKMKANFDQIELFCGRKIIGRLDYNISNMLLLLNKYYNWKFSVEIENIRKTENNKIVEILIKRNYKFKCYEYEDAGIFKKIKDFLIGKMEYNTQTKTLLAQIFKHDKNLIIKNFFNKKEEFKYEMSDFKIFLLTIGIYYKKMTSKKSQIVVKSRDDFDYNEPFINEYFEINEKYENDHPFTVFYDFVPKNISFSDKKKNNLETVSAEDEIKDLKNENNKNFEINEELKKIKYNEIKQIEYKIEKDEDDKIKEKFCIILNDGEFLKRLNFSEKEMERKNIAEISTDIKIKKNIIFLENLSKKDRKKLNPKNIYIKYLPFQEKIKLKKLLNEGKIIYSDYSINDIL
ncbi:single-stranded-DNA-specific exonuclease RecJ [Leptotrichia sp. oral taxon 847]|uniref:single-stranded-DNA-specific exonuclease RecJ n=1 Tax=Leptotrichia sp. oral taxon 847 TaxID=1785996 RepID=UPI0007682160|nr:single-stranded-DNA-specific exonuclease RecJ [Leptotrichia sp. oral taxon 847]AMD94911.1 single-stranded-DNA-specific exonuclease RecJ [Leptotrichia sp. oral taxon 847]